MHFLNTLLKQARCKGRDPKQNRQRQNSLDDPIDRNPELPDLKG